MPSKEWICPNCGTSKMLVVYECGQCGAKRPEGLKVAGKEKPLYVGSAEQPSKANAEYIREQRRIKPSKRKKHGYCLTLDDIERKMK